MPTTLVTGATGFVGSHVARALVARGDDVRVTVRATSHLDALDGVDVETVIADLGDRRAVRRALRGVERVFHVAGSTNLRAPAEALFEANVGTTRVVLEECLRAEVSRVVHTSSVAAVGPAPPGGRPTSGRCGAAGWGSRTWRRSTRPRSRRCGSRRAGCRWSSSARPTCWGAGTSGAPPPSSCGASCCGGSRPTWRARSTSSTSRTWPRGMLLADSAGVPGERYILGNRNYTWDRLFADLARLSGVEPPAVRLPVPAALALAETLGRAPGPTPVTPVEVRSAASGGPTARPRRGASSAGRRARTRRRSRPRSPGTASARAGGWRGSGRGRGSGGGRGLRRAAARRASSP